MIETHTTVNCPQCGTEVNVNEIVRQNAERILRREYEAKLQTEQTKVLEKEALLASKEASLNNKENEFDIRLQATLKTKLNEERKEIENAIKAKVELEQKEANKILEEELERKSQQLTEFNNTKAMLKKTQLEKEELASSIEAKTQERFNETLKEKTKEIANQEAAKSDKRISEQTEMINQLKKQLAESQRKIEQGSMQIQGETQEVAIEQFLKETFTFDEIEEIKKGVKGGDCLQKIHTREFMNCGTIYYESKRVKAFQMAWVDKLKQDMIEIGANIGVIVTEVLPSGMQRASQVNGIWVCTFEEFKGLSAILRESLILVNKAINSQINKGDKMEALYKFLTSSEFAMQVESIVEGFSLMKSELESEKRSINRIWKTREKQIALVLSNTTNMYGSLKGIIGNAIPTVKALELPAEEGI